MSYFGPPGQMKPDNPDQDLFANHLNAINMQMRSTNQVMNSMLPGSGDMLTPFGPPGYQQYAQTQQVGPPAINGRFRFPAMPNVSNLLNANFPSLSGASYCSSSVISMASGPDGRPQIYQAASTATYGPGGVRETRQMVQDSTRGVKKMAIGHFIGDRAHIIEKEHDLRSGQLDEHQQFVNLEEEQAEDFDHEFVSKAYLGGRPRQPAMAAPQRGLITEPFDEEMSQQQNCLHPHSFNAFAKRSNSRAKKNKQQQPQLPEVIGIPIGVGAASAATAKSSTETMRDNNNQPKAGK